MNLTEKISYIRGLCDGLELDESKPEVKVLNAIVDLLDDMAFEVSDMEELYDELSAQVDEIDQDLADVESDVYDDEDYDIEDYDDEDDDYDFDDEENPFYEVTCDSCGQKLNVSDTVSASKIAFKARGVISSLPPGPIPITLIIPMLRTPSLSQILSSAKLSLPFHYMPI